MFIKSPSGDNAVKLLFLVTYAMDITARAGYPWQSLYALRERPERTQVAHHGQLTHPQRLDPEQTL